VDAISISKTRGVKSHKGRNGAKSGTVVIDHDACTHCGRCVGACPFGAMLFDREKRTPYKCELCGNEDPACVSICPTGSIVLVQRKAFHSQPASLQMKGFTLLRERNKKSAEHGKRASGAASREQPT
jgi:Fe-S-cluster-containing hydrogenase component 2